MSIPALWCATIRSMNRSFASEPNAPRSSASCASVASPGMCSSSVGMPIQAIAWPSSLSVGAPMSRSSCSMIPISMLWPNWMLWATGSSCGVDVGPGQEDDAHLTACSWCTRMSCRNPTSTSDDATSLPASADQPPDHARRSAPWRRAMTTMLTGFCHHGSTTCRRRRTRRRPRRGRQRFVRCRRVDGRVALSAASPLATSTRPQCARGSGRRGVRLLRCRARGCRRAAVEGAAGATR